VNKYNNNCNDGSGDNNNNNNNNNIKVIIFWKIVPISWYLSAKLHGITFQIDLRKMFSCFHFI
jgi:hypothetical protein